MHTAISIKVVRGNSHDVIEYDVSAEGSMETILVLIDYAHSYSGEKFIVVY